MQSLSAGNLPNEYFNNLDVQYEYDRTLEKLSYTNVSQKNLMIENDGATSLLMQAPMTIFEIFFPALENYLVEVALPLEYHYRPEYISFKLYQTTSLWHFLLALNNCYSHKDFVMDTVKVLTSEGFKILTEYKERHTSIESQIVISNDITQKHILI